MLTMAVRWQSTNFLLLPGLIVLNFLDPFKILQLEVARQHAYVILSCLTLMVSLVMNILGPINILAMAVGWLTTRYLHSLDPVLRLVEATR